jgi:GntR family transcriptional regulator, nutrient-sensing system regulator
VVARPQTKTEPDRPAAEPKYYAVKRHLLEFIGSLEAGAAVPTERELAERMQTSRTTVRQALGELVVEGRLVRRQGSGTYVAEPKITWPLYLASFTEQVRASGFSPSAEVLGTQRIAAGSGEVAQQLHLAPRDTVHRIERLRLADNWPIAVETSWLPAERFPNLTRLIRSHGSLHALLAERYGIGIRAGDETIETAPATPRESGPLRVDVGTPMLVVSRQNFDSERVPVEFGRTWFRGDRVTLVTRLGPRRR